jgi:hypothetical protein
MSSDRTDTPRPRPATGPQAPGPRPDHARPPGPLSGLAVLLLRLRQRRKGTAPGGVDSETSRG